jgi:hypothetical protein
MNIVYLEGIQVVVEVLEAIFTELGSTELVDDENGYASRCFKTYFESYLRSLQITSEFERPDFIPLISLGFRDIFWNLPKSQTVSLGHIIRLLFAEIMAEFIAP